MTGDNMTSRYAICSTGNSYTVEDRRTGERLATSATWEGAGKIRRRLSDEARRAQTAGQHDGGKS